MVGYLGLGILIDSKVEDLEVLGVVKGKRRVPAYWLHFVNISVMPESKTLEMKRERPGTVKPLASRQYLKQHCYSYL